MRKLATVFILAFMAVPVFAEQSMDRFEKVAGRLITAINDANYPATHKDFAQNMLDFLSLEKAKEFFEGLSTHYGRIQKLDKPRLAPSGETVFVAKCERGVLDIKVWLNDNNKIIGLLFLPHTSDIPAPEKNKTELSLPFKGRWLVGWGGDTKELNIHNDAPNQRFAFDFIGTDQNNQTRKGQGQTNEDYFAFGREVLVPADGVVTDVINGVRDNTPGSMNPYSALGNAVFIQHSENEVSVLAHLKLDSITMKVGDKVKRGQVIGLCGNSGNSSEPHLHYHLQNTPIIQDGTGIKCYFKEMIVESSGKKEPRTNYSPIKDQIILVQ